MNVIIIAACIPTLRPLFLILFKRASSSDFASHRRQSSYHKHPSSTDPKSSSANPPTVGSRGSKAFDKYPITRELTRTSTDSQRSLSGKKDVERTSKNSILVEETICVESREIHTSDSSQGEGEREWGSSSSSRGRGGLGTGVPLSEMGKPSRSGSRERAATVTVGRDGQGVTGEDMV